MAQITLGDGVGKFDFTGISPDLLTVGSSGLSGQAYFGSNVGTYTLGPLSPVTAGPLVGGNFAMGQNSQTFAFAGPPGSLSGIVHWQIAKDHSAFPDLIGNLDMQIVSGWADFVGTFSSHVSSIDLTLKLPVGSPWLDEIAPSGESNWAMVSSGEIIDRSSAVVEPSTFVVLAMALALLTLTHWWGRKAKASGAAREA